MYSTYISLNTPHYTECRPLNLSPEVAMENTSPLIAFSSKRIREVTRRIIMCTDTSAIRVALALASFIFSITIAIQPEDSTLPHWRSITSLINVKLFAAVFFLHAVGLSWRFLDPKPRVMWSLVINSFGLLIWTASAITFNVSTWKHYATIFPNTALEIVMCIFAAWTLLRTGQKNETLNP